MIYLDNAATSYPKPDSVYEAMKNFMHEAGANPGRSGHKMAVRAERMIENTRHLVAQLFGIADSQRVIFTLNCTDALNMAMKGSLSPGDHVITSMLEHNSVTRPLQRMSDEGMITLSRVTPSSEGYVDPDDIAKEITENTKLVVLTHASNVIGTVQPIAEVGKIVRGKDKLFLVDAAQTAGIRPIDVEACCIDLLAFPGHKGLLGPTGSGGLYVGERAKLFPWREGGTGGDSASPVQPAQLPFYLEGGTPNTMGIAGLNAGLGFLCEKGIDAIRDKEEDLRQRLVAGLQQQEGVTLCGASDGGEHVSVVSFNLSRHSPEEVAAILDETFDIAVRPGLHCAPCTHQTIGTYPAGAVRLSPGYFTLHSEIDLALDALRQIVEHA